MMKYKQLMIWAIAFILMVTACQGNEGQTSETAPAAGQNAAPAESEAADVSTTPETAARPTPTVAAAPETAVVTAVPTATEPVEEATV